MKRYIYILLKQRLRIYSSESYDKIYLHMHANIRFHSWLKGLFYPEVNLHRLSMRSTHHLKRLSSSSSNSISDSFVDYDGYCKKAKWLSEQALQIAEKRREVKGKGVKERYII